MPIKLREAGEAAWVELHSGAALLCEPPTTPRVYAARAMAEGVMVDLIAAGEALTRVGGHIVGGPDLDSEAGLEATRQTLVIVSLAEIAVKDWRGILDDDGQTLPFKPSLLVKLLSDQFACEAFSSRYLRPIHEVVAEGNVSRPLPDGTSGRAGGKSTAPAASSREPRARPRARKTARTTRTRH